MDHRHWAVVSDDVSVHLKACDITLLDDRSIRFTYTMFPGNMDHVMLCSPGT